jgi:hypothetical protein
MLAPHWTSTVQSPKIGKMPSQKAIGRPTSLPALSLDAMSDFHADGRVAAEFSVPSTGVVFSIRVIILLLSIVTCILLSVLLP